MNNLILILVAIVICINAYMAFFNTKKNLSLEDRVVSMAQEIAANKQKTAELTAAYEEAQELIKATKEYTKEATHREILMQNGIDSILGYDAMTALKDGRDKV